MIRKSVSAGILTLSILAGSMPAHAGGDDYFAGDDSKIQGPVYYGFVWDVNGPTITGAMVTLRPKTGKPVELKTNVLGMYRSHISKDVRPEDVQVSCEKAGYKQTKVTWRTKETSVAKAIEIDCHMRRG